MRACRRLCRKTWLKLVILVSAALAIYELHDLLMAAHCSDDELQQSLAALCQLYHEGDIAGDLCPALCDTKEITYETCLNYRHGKRIVTVKYRGQYMVLKAKHGYLREYADISYTVDNVTHFPDVNDFNKMLLETLSVNFDSKIPERRDMLTRLWTLPFHELKTDKEKKAAMRSIWSLVQQDEYLFFRYFDTVESFPRIKGSCGYYYAVENAPPGPVLGTKPLSMDDSPWNDRRDIAIKFLELITNLESSFQGKFHMCDVKAENFGLNDNNELKVIDVDLSFFSKRVYEQFDLETCRKDADCKLLDCYGRCDMERKTCKKERVNSNLQAVCSKIFSHRLSTGYRGLLRYPPSLLQDSLETLLDECSTLSSDNPRYTDELPETVYWKLKNLLKKPLANQIADYVGFR